MYIFEQDKNPLSESRVPVVRKMASASLKSDWRVYSTLSDDLGQIHYRLQHYYSGMAVELSTAISHEKEGQILSVNGDLVPENMLNGRVVVNEDEALAIALKLFPADKYYWQIEHQNDALRKATGNLDTSYLPKGLLVWCPKDFQLRAEHRLAYKFNVYAEAPLFGKTIYIDAETGELLATNDLILHTEVTGTATTKYSGSRSIQTDSTAPGNYRLREAGRGKGIETYNLKNGTSYGAAVDFTDADNNWNNVNIQKDEVATDAHWGAEMTYDYFKVQHNRNSFDNNGAKILSYIHYSSNYNNAFWNGSYMTYGDGNGTTFTPLTGIDVCGHEIAHAVTTYSANLVYSYESGALNESFSDVFGNSIEAWARPGKWNWRIGEDITPSKNGIRSMLNPNLFSHPKFYKGVSWYFGAGDNGGVHYNSGVQNYWYYLIANGATGNNEKGWAFSIDSLGLEKAGKIAYRNLTVYLTKNSQYADARTYSIMAATDLYGPCSKEVIMVTNAWWVCGVGAKYDSGFVKADFKGDTLACYTGRSVKFSNLSTNFLSCKWYFGDGNTSTSTNPTHTYSSFGSFNIKLVANSCFKNKSDSITRTAYVKVDSTRDICNAAIVPFSGTDSVVRCKGFIYDDGGEGNYGALKQVNLKVSIPNADSIRFRFLVLDYENGYDSVVLFKNAISWANKIGRFTGSTLPFAGAWQTVKGNALWVRQYTDPLVEGKGFKIQFEGIRPLLTVDLGNDTTICFGDSLSIVPKISGGYTPHFLYRWKHGETVKDIEVKPSVNSKYFLTVTDACTLKSAADSVAVSLRNPLKITLPADTIICLGNAVNLKTAASGGLSTAYKFSWNNGLGNAAVHLVKPGTTTTYKVTLTDGCTPVSDSADITVFVKPGLKAVVSADATPVCIGKTVNLSVTGSGGDTAGYIFTWNNGLGTGLNKSVVLNDTGKYTVTLTDGCSVSDSKDSVTLFSFSALKLTKSADTTVCRGSNVNISSTLTGGLGSGYNYSWQHGKSGNSISETPVNDQWYVVTGSDNCSPQVKDSVKITLFAPLALSKVSDTTLCDGQNLPLILTHTGGRTSSHSITWTPGGVVGFTPVLAPAAGKTNYMAILSDACTVKPDTAKFSVTMLNPLSAVFTVSPSVICYGDSTSINIAVSGGKSGTRSWTVDGIPVTWTKQRIRPLADKVFTFNLTDGCSVPFSTNAAVSISPAASAILAVDKKLICVRDQVNFSYSSADASKVIWHFTAKDSMNGTGINLAKNFNLSGKYGAWARVTNSVGCSVVIPLADSVQVVDYPKAGFVANPDVTNIENPNVLFTDNSTGATSYLWSFGDGNTSSASGTQTHTYADTGWFTATLVVSIPPGCSDMMSKQVRIKDVYKLFIPNGFTPDDNNLNDKLWVKGRGISSFSMQIYDRWGSKVFSTNDINKAWDGKSPQGADLAQDMFIWRVSTIDSEGYRHEEKGVIFLLR